MNTIKRINPRRPFTFSSTGLRRIALGAQDSIPMCCPTSLDVNGRHAQATKPRRALDTVQRVLLVAVSSERGSLNEHARQTLAAAALVADSETEVALVVLGALNDDAAALGADKVIVLSAFDCNIFAPERALAALCRCIAQLAPAHVLMPDNATGDGDLGRRYAAHARASVATHVVEIDACHIGAYMDAGTRLATRAWPDVVLLAPDAVVSTLPFIGAGEHITLNEDEDKKEAHISDSDFSAFDRGIYRDLGIEQVECAQLALEEADFIVSAGNGVTDIAAFETLAHALNAAIGASRVAVDNGYFSRDKQIGVTGKTVSATVYFALGISGAVQHLQGIKDCRHVIAVNIDSGAPIVKRADLTVIEDAHQIIHALTEIIMQAHAARSAPISPIWVEGIAA